jgi:hypothetical protein
MDHSYDIDLEDDGIVIHHYINDVMIDAPSYIDDDDIKSFMEFYQEFGYLPNRKEHPTDSVGALNRKRIEEIRQFKNQHKIQS